MTSLAPQSAASFERHGHIAIAIVLVAAFVTGGGASDHGLDDAFTELLSLPLLAWAVLALMAAPANGLRRAAIIVATLVFAVVALQQLRLPEALWHQAAPRVALADDLRAAGVDSARQLWSLSPLASERSLWSLLPALAVFFGTLSLPPARQRAMLLLLVALAAASLLLGYLQLGAPQDSLLNPFPQWAPALNGFFANPNHQAAALAISVIVIAALLLDERGREPQALPRWSHFVLAALAVVLLASLPLAGSRAVFLLAVLGLVAVPLLLRNRRRPAGSPAMVWLVRGALAVLALGAIASAIGWLQFDLAHEVRVAVARVTAAMGTELAPSGAGVGSFVPWFDQNAPASLMQREYFNHAHNEYVQWWLESGVAGVITAASAVALLLACRPRPAHDSGDRAVAVAAWLGCLLLLLHSAVDYPLRTPALMTVAGLLAGIVVAHRVAVSSRAREST
jgi:O-antigen ligase